MHRQKKLMRNVYGENFKKPRNSHKHWSCEASMSFLVSKTGFYLESPVITRKIDVLLQKSEHFPNNKKGTKNVVPFFTYRAPGIVKIVIPIASLFSFNST